MYVTPDARGVTFMSQLCGAPNRSPDPLMTPQIALLTPSRPPVCVTAGAHRARAGGARGRRQRGNVRFVGPHTDFKPLFSHFTTGEFKFTAILSSPSVLRWKCALRRAPHGR